MIDSETGAALCFSHNAPNHFGIYSHNPNENGPRMLHRGWQCEGMDG